MHFVTHQTGSTVGLFVYIYVFLSVFVTLGTVSTIPDIVWSPKVVHPLGHWLEVIWIYAGFIAA